MRLTYTIVARQLAAYLHHKLSLENLLDWANAAMMEDDFEEAYYDAIRHAVARLGLANVRAFGLTWEDCGAILKHPGDNARVDIVAV